MSIVTIQVGQCGNQIGHAFFDTLMKDFKDCSPIIQERLIQTFFQRDFENDQLVANAILVDMEPKVVQRCLNDTNSVKGLWRFEKDYSYFKQGGSGNNWALGYYYYGQQEYEATYSRIQTLLENIDYFGGFQVFQSLAGGTGSGLGAHIVECIRDDFSKVNMLNTSIWPYSQGEVILQNYNVLLTLNSLIHHSNAVIPIYNDEVLSICRELLKNPRPSYKVMNTVIAQMIASYMFPCANTTKERVSLWDGPNTMNGIVQTLCSFPQCKMLSLKAIPHCDARAIEFNSELWLGMIQRIRQMVVSNTSEYKVNWNIKVENPGAKFIKSIGNMVFLRGDKVYDETLQANELFSYPKLYSSKYATSLQVLRDSHRIFGHEKAIAVLSNNQSHVSMLERTLRKATMMMEEKAYLHHYNKFGVDSERMSEAFMTCESTLAEYKAL